MTTSANEHVEPRAPTGNNAGTDFKRDERLDGGKLLRILFAAMAVHEHSFRVKDVAPGYLVNQYEHLVAEIEQALPDDLRDELDHLVVLGSDDPNLSETQSTAASLIGWLNGVLITTGTVSINAPPQLPSQLVSPDRAHPREGPSGQYL